MPLIFIESSIDGGAVGEFKVIDSSPVHSDDNFTRVTVKNARLSVEVFHRKGKKLGRIKSYPC